MLALLASAAAHVPIVYVTGPDEDWCGVLAGTVGNDIVMLRAGEYHGPCTFVARLSDVAAELTVLQSLDPLDHAVFVDSPGAPALTIEGERAILLELTFRGAFDAVRIGTVREAWVRQVVFEGVASGVTVAARGPGDPYDIHVTDSEFHAVGVAVDAAADALVQDNWVEGGDLAFHVAAGAEVTLRDNVAVGVGQGAVAEGTALLEGERYVATVAAVDLVGGEIVASVLEGAVRVAGTSLVGDTVLGPLEGTPSRAISCAFDPAPAALDAGSFDCAAAGCFVDRAGGDLYPAAGSVLVGGGVADPVSRADWCGFPRAAAPTAGAFEWVGPGALGPLVGGFKRDHPCELAGGPGDSGAPPTDGPPTDTGTGTATGGTSPTTEPPVVETSEPEGCGCASSAAPSAGWAVLFAAFGRRRRSPAPDTLAGSSAPGSQCRTPQTPPATIRFRGSIRPPGRRG